MLGTGKWTRALCAGSLVCVALVAAACTPSPPVGPSPTTSTPGDAPPVISSFASSKTTGSAPLTTAFTWSVSDPDSAHLTCALDSDGDDVYETLVPSCSSSSVRSVTYSTPGTRSAHLLVSDGSSSVGSSVVTIDVSPPSADTFDIVLRFDASVTVPQRAVFEAAATRWKQVVRTGLPDATLSAAANLCGTGAPAFNGTVDDVLIDVSIVPIDGVDGVLGSAGPCVVRSGGGLPVLGAMQFDSADVAALATEGTLPSVILHEMGHVLGFGTVWSQLVVGAGTSDPKFTGLVGRGAWSALAGGSGVSVPVENVGGVGTADSHWRESIFGNELMTGYVSVGVNPLSTVTIGALADLGYGVDLGAADAFGSPAARSGLTTSRQIRTQLIEPVLEVG